MSGEKIYEYRTRFLDEWLEKYKNDEIVSKRIVEYKERKNAVVMPVLLYQETILISRAELESALGKFVWRQSYYFLKDDMPLTKYIDDHIQFIGERHENDFSVESKEDVCKKYK